MISKNSEYEQEKYQLQTKMIEQNQSIQALKLYVGSVAGTMILLLSVSVWVNYRKRKQYERMLK